LYMKVAFQFTTKIFSTLPANRLLAVSRPVLSRVIGSPTTILQQIRDSRLPAAVFSGAFRRLTRPNGRVVKKLSASRPLNYDTMIAGINSGDLTAAPPKVAPAGAPNTADFATRIFSLGLSGWWLWLIRKHIALFFPLVILLLLLAALTGACGKLRIICRSGQAEGKSGCRRGTRKPATGGGGACCRPCTAKIHAEIERRIGDTCGYRDGRGRGQS